MRPKKRILCVSPSEQDLSVLKYMLYVRGFQVFGASNSQEAIAIFSNEDIELVVVVSALPLFDGDILIGKLKEIARHIPMIILGNPSKDMVRHADALLCRRTISSFELYERIKIMSARKRGPRPGRSSTAQTAPLEVCPA